MAEIHDQFDTILILDFGSQYSHLITRRCRELNVYAELMPCTQKIKDLNFKPKGVILSGSPYSVYDADAPHVDPAVFELGVPVLGICYGLQEMAWNMKGKVAKCEHREYGFAQVQITKIGNGDSHADALFEGLGDELQVWMSHGDQLSEMPADFHIIGRTDNAPYAAIAHNSKPFYGIQFHPEVTHSPRGKEVIARFVLNISGCKTNWTMEEFIGKEIARIREICGPKGRVIGAVSGGVDSSVAAKLMHEAIGDRFHAIMVDNGVLRLNEAKQVHEMLNKDLGVNLTVVDASDLFLSRLEGIEDPEQKRKIIGNTFINIFEDEAAKIEADAEKEEAKGAKAKGKIEWLLQGTLYPDVIESISFKARARRSRHITTCSKARRRTYSLSSLANARVTLDEVRALGRLLNIPNHLVQRHPFPGPGLAIRILGPVTRDQISQAFAVLLPVKAVGVMGDARTYEQVIALRAVQSEDFMTADWYVFPPEVLRRISSRITNEVKGINRVTYDISSKPPSTVEWL
ncbi:GMP synthase [glutamine-hydrolyzing] [Grifola frondosa]|uniref:GMP synthase [glutamine-hydrolyzing] n=1 Tax=Grifola frondosa TaxID=5627 RepID=A0A1C7LQF6_GRIFR|nr:GMP synthase [glutamine-hydrolyzing] [Grifola frondosa]